VPSTDYCRRSQLQSSATAAVKKADDMVVVRLAVLVGLGDNGASRVVVAQNGQVTVRGSRTQADHGDQTPRSISSRDILPRRL
jgi:hypothetical protein